MKSKRKFKFVSIIIHSFAFGILIVSLSIAYYFAIALPKIKQSTLQSEKKNETKTIYTTPSSTISPINTETPIPTTTPITQGWTKEQAFWEKANRFKTVAKSMDYSDEEINEFINMAYQTIVIEGRTIPTSSKNTSVNLNVSCTTIHSGTVSFTNCY